MPVDRVVTLSLPSTRTAALWPALAAAGRQLAGDVRVVILRGDADFFVDAQAHDAVDEPPAGALEWLGRPDLITVAAISGRATGAGLDVALACDLRVVCDDAQLSASASMGGIGRLGELMGSPRALEFVLAGAPISGRQAVASGLANLSVPPDNLEAAVAEMVASVLRTPREVATLAKAVLRESASDRRRRADELVAGIRLAANES